MIGNAAVAFMPSRPTRIMHGAYMPMPSVISAPSTKLPTRPSTSFDALQIERALPRPAGDEAGRAGHFRDLRQAKSTAGDEQRAAHPDLNRCASASFATMPAPSHAPATARQNHQNQRHRIDLDGEPCR